MEIYDRIYNKNIKKLTYKLNNLKKCLNYFVFFCDLKCAKNTHRYQHATNGKNENLFNFI